MKEVVLEETNKGLKKIATFEELLQFFGLWFLTSTTSCALHRREFWSFKETSIFEGAPFRFSSIMSRRRFEEIMSNLKITDTETPTYKDVFWEVRQLLDAWNENMANVFSPNWISCLDESMSK